MRYQTALLPETPLVGRIATLANPPDWLSRGGGGPGRIRTYNLAVMSGQLYR